MTTYIPSLTIPSAVLQHPAASVLLPIALGTAVGFGTRRTRLASASSHNTKLTVYPATETQKTYLALKQPPLRPPPWLFGPVWTVIYGIMGYASHRIATIGLSSISPATVETAQSSLTLYTVQLGLNLAWMPLFFVAKRPIEASIDIVTLIGLNGYLAYLWGSIDEVAGWCQVPYLGWLGFATYLCVGAGYLNGWDLHEKEVKQE